MDVFDALADPLRRDLLDRLRLRGGLTLGALCAGQPVTRQAVSRHLGVLEEVGLITVHWRGREKLHYLNPVPLAEIVHRWLGRFEDARMDALHDIKTRAEEKHRA